MKAKAATVALAALAALMLASPLALAQAEGDVAPPTLDDGSDVLQDYDPDQLGATAEPDGSDLKAVIAEVAGGQSEAEAEPAAAPPSAAPSEGSSETPAPGLALAGLAVAGAALLVGRRR